MRQRFAAASKGRDEFEPMEEILRVASILAFLAVSMPAAYLLLPALVSLRRAPSVAVPDLPSHRFAVLIPAHDEARVIRGTLRSIHALDYPADLFHVHVIADHCSDPTAEIATTAGAEVHERNTGRRGGKGGAISWFCRHRLEPADCDAVVIWDADTRPDRRFLRVMDARLASGAHAVQGRHVISNPNVGWFAALVWAMFIIDNRFQNLGRANLGWSAKNMGDSICLRMDLLGRTGWKEGQADDYELRQRLLIDGARIAYEPAAIAYGQAPPDLRTAWQQRSRWIQGAHAANRQHARRLAIAGIRSRDAARFDGALQAYAPAYSTLCVVTAFLLVTQVLLNRWLGPVFPAGLLVAWAVLLALLFLYPFAGLALESAPLRAYAALCLGPFFIGWRTWIALRVRIGRMPTSWIRTPHVDGGAGEG